jgi:hypothetical protein
VRGWNGTLEKGTLGLLRLVIYFGLHMRIWSGYRLQPEVVRNEILQRMVRAVPAGLTGDCPDLTSGRGPLLENVN